MRAQHWSFVLSWSRLGINAALFLYAARVLTLAEIGVFATAFAPIKVLQSIQKAGLSDAVVLFGNKGRRWTSLFGISLIFAATGTTICVILGLLFSPMLLALALVPMFNGLGAIPDGILRKDMRIRALALRTVTAQSIAACIALGLLWGGFGAWALVGFACVSAALTNGVSIGLAGWRPVGVPSRRGMGLVLPKTAQSAGRVALTTAHMPLAQLAIGIALGPAAAGAFQIATRMFELIDALALSPLRFTALPKLAQACDLRSALRDQTRQAVMLGVWIWGGLWAAAVPIVTIAVGADHAPHVAPILQGLAPLGLCAAILMPISQGLIAKGYTGLMLRRALLVVITSAVLMLPAVLISPSACAIALSLAGVTGQIWLLIAARPRLGLSLRDLGSSVAPLLAGGLMVAALLGLPAQPLWGQIIFGTLIYALSLTMMSRHHLRSFA